MTKCPHSQRGNVGILSGHFEGTFEKVGSGDRANFRPFGIAGGHCGRPDRAFAPEFLARAQDKWTN